MAAKQAFQTLLKNAGSTIGLLVSVGGPGMKKEFVDITNHGLSDPCREFMATLIDGGEVEFKVLVDQTNQPVLEGLFYDMTFTSWTIHTTHSTPTVITFSGCLSEYPVFDSAEVDGVYECTCKIKVTGKPTIA